VLDIPGTIRALTRALLRRERGGGGGLSGCTLARRYRRCFFGCVAAPGATFHLPGGAGGRLRGAYYARGGGAAFLYCRYIFVSLAVSGAFRLSPRMTPSWQQTWCAARAAALGGGDGDGSAHRRGSALSSPASSHALYVLPSWRFHSGTVVSCNDSFGLTHGSCLLYCSPYPACACPLGRKETVHGLHSPSYYPHYPALRDMTQPLLQAACAACTLQAV